MSFNLYIDDKKAQNSIGYFFSSLKERMSKIKDVRITPNTASAQIILCGPTSDTAMKWLGRKKVVQRLDGVYFNSDNLQSTISKNLAITSIYNRANGVIFQSQYSKNMVEGLIGKCNKVNEIILNGSDIKDKHYARAEKLFPEVSKLKSEGYSIFLAAASWRPVKRASTIVEGFLEYKKKYPKSIMYFAGEEAGSLPEGIVNLGRLPHSTMLSFYPLIDLLINLSFSDACPNVVVEALSARKPILASSNQGSAELYGGNGYIIPEPFQWNFKPISYSKMPTIEPKAVSDGIDRALSTGYCNDIDVSMESCAENYRKFLHSIVYNNR